MKFYLRIAAAIVILAVIIWLLQEFGQRESPPAAPSVASATPTPAPAAPTPAPTPVPVVQRPATVPDYIPRAANGAHVKLTGTQLVNDWWYITVVGRDRNALNDFLDMAMKFGLRDVDVNYQAYKEFITRGEQHAQNTYKMRF